MYKLFTSEYWGPCKQLGSLPDTVEKVDVQKNPEAAIEHKVTSIPTLINEAGDRFIGLEDIQTELRR